jgi:hypothetical protein
MSKSPQRRAIDNYRSRLTERGPDADKLRAAVSETIGGEPPKKGGIVRALLASPLIGSELDLTRPFEEGRKVDI